MRARFVLAGVLAKSDLLPRDEIRAVDIVPAVNRWVYFFLYFAPHIKQTRGTWAEHPLVRIGSEHIHMLDGRRESANRLNSVHAKQNLPIAQELADRGNINSIATDKVARCQRDQTRVLIHLPHHVHRTNHAQT